MTNTELAILSLIAEKDRHGYEIESLIEERGMREWTEIGFSSIYYILKKLEKKKWIKGKVVRQAGPGRSRVVYHISAAGRKALRASTLEALSVPHSASSPMQLGLANLPAVSKEGTYPGQVGISAALALLCRCHVRSKPHKNQRRA